MSMSLLFSNSTHYRLKQRWGWKIAILAILTLHRNSASRNYQRGLVLQPQPQPPTLIPMQEENHILPEAEGKPARPSGPRPQAGPDLKLMLAP